MVTHLQTLAIPDALRAQLAAENLLAINSHGQEVLHGLDFAESQLLVECTEASPDDAARRERCAELVVKHERARLRIATVDDERTASKF
ncbi:hypothetical protein M2165_004850 [Variovorax sp. TBS-050B]|jgi:hypothetical protein|uniref:hypothetical protein n=1 Tax=Variovorax sp. TBS-050B TaxID=2940551 RepID=UPI00247622B0|nr:hypothetical protein [Variovorax sp. TBS-050B]MDH6594961.1 hypothetical protein [Variovorax sp. TBS-050B]